MSKRCMGCMREFESGNICPVCGFNSDSAPELPGDLEIYTIIADRYLIGRVIRRTNFSITYLAWDNRMDKSVNVTEYFPRKFAERRLHDETVYCVSTENESDFSQCRSTVLSQGRKLAGISIASGDPMLNVTDCFESNNTVYIVTNTINGTPLSEILESGVTYPYGEAKNMMIPVIEMLSSLHEKGIFHCNITPDSLIVDDNGRIHVTGFSDVDDISILGAQERKAYLNNFYTSPDIMIGTAVPGAGTDVFSICAVMYVMICGADGLRYQLSKGLLVDKGTNEFAADVIINGMNGQVFSCRALLTEFGDVPKKISAANAAAAAAKSFVPAYTPPVTAPAPVTVNVPAPVTEPQQTKKKSGLAVPLICLGVVLVLFIVLIVVIVTVRNKPEQKDTPTYHTTSAAETTESGLLEPGSSLSESSNKIYAGEDYYFTPNSAGTYIFESVDSDGSITCELSIGGSSVSFDDENSAGGSNFRTVAYCKATEKIKIHTSSSSVETFKIKVYSAEVKTGSNNVPYEDNIRYTLNITRSGYYLFDASGGGYVSLYTNDSEQNDGKFFACYVDASKESYVKLYGFGTSESASFEISSVPELTTGSNTCDASDNEYFVFAPLSDGYYRFTSSGSFKFIGSNTYSAVKNYSDYNNYTYEFDVELGSDSYIFIEFDSTGSQSINISTESYGQCCGFSSFYNYAQNGVYVRTTDHFYRTRQVTDQYVYFNNADTYYAAAYYVDESSSTLWLGFKMNVDGSNIIAWFPAELYSD